MQRYVLTERGKYLIAIIIVFLVLITTLVYVIRLIPQSPAEPSIGTNGDNQDGLESDDPGENPDVTPEPTPTPPGGDDNVQETPDPSLSGPIYFSLDAGVLAFLFTPHVQDKIDENTDSLIGELLTSPKNDEDAKISVEVPQLPDDDKTILTAAIINSLNLYDILLSDIIFFTYQPEPDIQTFEIKISILPLSLTS